MYIRFAGRLCSHDEIPGRDVRWNPSVLWRYMLFRFEKCKPTTVFSCLSALAHFGHHCRFVLPTKKDDGNALLHRDIACMKREISILHRQSAGEEGSTYGVKQSTPMGRSEVELLLAAFEVFGERTFLRLSRQNRHHIVACALQHGCAMRFGHFLYRKYTIGSFVLGADGVFRLVTDWHRYEGQRRYCLQFASSPRWDCLSYGVRRADGSVAARLTAADLLAWHFRQLRRVDEYIVFAPRKGVTPSRQLRQRWLRSAVLAALPLGDHAARVAAELITPHAFRAGLAGDLNELDVQWQTIALWCRWHSMRAMRMYASRPALQASRVSRGFRVIHPFWDFEAQH